MSDVAVVDTKNSTFSKRAFRHVLNWFFLAALAFIVVVLFYQLIIGLISLGLGYQTHVHFGKVDTMPYYNRYWSNSRVLALYAFPAIFFLFVTAFVLCALLFAPEEGNWRWVAFWVMVFSALLSSSLLSMSLISAMVARGSLYQGFAVVSSWFGLSSAWSISFITLAGFINIALGFVCSPVLLKLAPPDFILRKEKKSPMGIVINSFICPIILLFPIAILLSYPGYGSFFAVMFAHFLFWLPGLFTISLAKVGERRSRGKTTPETYSSYWLVGLTLSLIIIIRIFFA